MAGLATVPLKFHDAFGPVGDVLVEHLADYVGASLEVVHQDGEAFL